jgi:hypothetical protein
MIDRLPQPPLIRFGPDDTPHFIELTCAPWAAADGVTARTRRWDQRGSDGVKCVGFFYHGEHGRGANPSPVGGGTTAAPSEGQVDHLASDFGGAAPILVGQENDPPVTPLVLTPIALGSGGLFARFDDCRAVAVWTLHGTVDRLFLLAPLSCKAILYENYSFVTLPLAFASKAF